MKTAGNTRLCKVRKRWRSGFRRFIRQKGRGQKIFQRIAVGRCPARVLWRFREQRGRLQKDEHEITKNGIRTAARLTEPEATAIRLVAAIDCFSASGHCLYPNRYVPAAYAAFPAAFRIDIVAIRGKIGTI